MYHVCYNIWQWEGKFVHNTSTDHMKEWCLVLVHTLLYTIVCISKMCINEIVILNYYFQFENCDFKSQF